MSGFLIHFEFPPEVEERLRRREPEVIPPPYINEEKRIRKKIKKNERKKI